VGVAPSRDGPFAVLDDDPTGVQTLSRVRVLLDWSDDRVTRALGCSESIHLLTNSRAFNSRDARTLVGSAASAIETATPRATVVLRGDSTLRGHVLEEYLGLRDARRSEGYPPLVLVPALPSAGRVTIDGVQYLERDGRRVPVHTTEFARDGPFAYTSSRLLEWADERTAGLFKAGNGLELRLESLRLAGPETFVDTVQKATTALAPTAVSVDAETAEDVEAVAEGVRRAVAAGGDFVVRCGPTLAGALGHATAPSFVDLPSSRQVLVVCGSYVQQSVRQLEALQSRFPDQVVEVDPFELVAADCRGFSEITTRVYEHLETSGLAVLAVAGPRPTSLSDLESGLRVAGGLAALVASIHRSAALVVLKGGVTSAVVIKDGLGALQAEIVGPVLPGVALWQILEPEPCPVLVVPGNVGDDGLLVRIVDLVRGDHE
jgi:uncharacterized protein YgbK (DUF1537 family)